MTEAKLLSLISFEYVTCIDFVYHVVQTTIVPISNNCFALLLELRQIVNHLRAKERLAIGNRRLIDDDFGTFGLDALHDALDKSDRGQVRVTESDTLNIPSTQARQSLQLAH